MSIIKYISAFFILVLVSCSNQTDTNNLIAENEFLKHENDSLKQRIESLNPNLVEVSHVENLHGTTFLPNSSKMIGLLNKGLEPINFQIIKVCQPQKCAKEDYPEFIDIRRNGSTLTIDIEIIANCCHNFLAEAEILGKDTLNLIYTDYGGFCSWGTCMLRYSFDTTLETEYQTLKYVTINGDQTIGNIPH